MDKYWQIFYLGQNLGVSFQVEHFFGSNRTWGQKFDKNRRNETLDMFGGFGFYRKKKKLVFPEKNGFKFEFVSAHQWSGEAVLQAVEN